MLNKYPCIDRWSNIRCIQLNFHPSLYFFLEQLDGLCPNVSSIMIRTENYIDQSIIIKPVTISFEIGQRNLNDIRLENVTKLQFGGCCSRSVGLDYKLTYQDKLRAKVFAHLISMPVQLKYLLVEKFQWLVHVIKYYFCLLSVQNVPSCNHGSNESIDIGKRLILFLSTYMPQLQTLRLWRKDDFPWTT
ncbi:unnamed protein product, partial [Rotaria magnacalcarata]